MRARAAYLLILCLGLAILSGCSMGDLPAAPTPAAPATTVAANIAPTSTSAPASTAVPTSPPQPTNTARPRSTSTPRLAATSTQGKSILPISTATRVPTVPPFQATEVFPDTSTPVEIFPTDTTQPTRVTFRATPTRPSTLESPTVTSKDFNFLDQNDYVNSTGDAVVVGLIKYVGDTTIANIEIEVDLEDGSHKLLDTQSADVVPNLVPPGGLIPFSATFSNPPTDYQFYNTTVQGFDADQSSLDAYTTDLSISQTSLLPGADVSTPKLVGKVTNTGSSKAQDPQVIAAILDDNGHVLDVNWAYTTLSNLDPGQQTSFEMSFENGDTATKSEAIVSASIAP
jgi:hypothetical protein